MDPSLYPLKTSENRIFCFQGVENWYIGKEWVDEQLKRKLNCFMEIVSWNVYSLQKNAVGIALYEIFMNMALKILT